MSNVLPNQNASSGSFPDDNQLELIIRDLPAAPRILAELGPHLLLLDFDVREVTSILRRDSSLTARLIHMANSVAYVGAEPCTSLEEAVARIGYRETYRLLGAVASIQLANEPLHLYGIAARRLRENSLFVALVIEDIASIAGIDARTGYTIGLLRSLGKVVLERLARANGQPPQFDPNREELASWERRHWGCTNPDIGARILELWRFPADAIGAVRDQYLPPADRPFSTLLHIAAEAADIRGFGLPGEAPYWLRDESRLALLGLDEPRFTWACTRAYSTLAKVSTILS